MKVNIKKLDKKASFPFNKYNSDFCYDVVAVSEEEVAPNVWKYGLGLAMQIERGEETVLKGETPEWGKNFNFDTTIDMKRCPFKACITFRPRSSIWKTGMILSNGIGTIDENYTGEIMAIFYHVVPTLPRYRVGDRIGQVHLDCAMPIEFSTVSDLKETDRADKGYGSTGK